MFNKLREKAGKQFVKKYQYPFGPLWQETNSIYKSQVTGQLIGHETFGRKKETPEEMLARIEAESEAMEEADYQSELESLDTSVTAVEQTVAKGDEIAEKSKSSEDTNVGQAILGGLKKGFGVARKVGKVLAEDAMGDKNFGAQSQAIDAAVDGVSNMLESTGNPYAIMASKAIQGANFLTKAGGQTVQGFDVDINSSGYGQIGHMESSSSRDFGAMIHLGGLNQGKMQAKLAKRNQQALMAMNAANIAEEQSFEQEARMNSIQNTIMNNQMALAGGLDTSLLGG